MTINIDIFDFIIDKILFIFTWLNSISIGGLFSLLDFSLALLLIGIALPLVLNLRKSMASRGGQ